MGGQVLLPGLAVTHLVALSKAVAVCVDAAPLLSVQTRAALTIVLRGGNSRAAVDPISGHIAPQRIAHFPVVFRPGRFVFVQKNVDGFPGHGGLAQVVLVGDHRVLRRRAGTAGRVACLLSPLAHAITSSSASNASRSSGNGNSLPLIASMRPCVRSTMNAVFLWSIRPSRNASYTVKIFCAVDQSIA